MPEAERYLDNAQQCVANARTSLTINLTNDAGRSAYLAAFHAAQVFIFERTGKVAETHKGVHTAFARLVKDESQLDDSVPPCRLQQTAASSNLRCSDIVSQRTACSANAIRIGIRLPTTGQWTKAVRAA